MKYFLALLLLTPFVSLSQNTGLYGKKTILEVQGHGSWPVYTSWFNPNTFYKRQGDGLKEGRNLMDAGVRVGLMHAFSNQVGIGVEYGMEYQNVATQDNINIGYASGSFDYINNEFLRHEAINLSTFTIMPKFEFSNKSNLLPIGLSHQLGIGYTSTRMVEKDYVFNINYSSSDSITSPVTDGVLDYSSRWTGFTVMYQISMRTPITDMIMISYGLRYNANFVRNYPFDPIQPGILNTGLLVKEKRNDTFLQLHIGAAIAF
ncbi:MAG: hypothetical protein ACFHU9_06950 [Fluviicola sp.]